MAAFRHQDPYVESGVVAAASQFEAGYASAGELVNGRWFQSSALRRESDRLAAEGIAHLWDMPDLRWMSALIAARLEQAVA